MTALETLNPVALAAPKSRMRAWNVNVAGQLNPSSYVMAQGARGGALLISRTDPHAALGMPSGRMQRNGWGDRRLKGVGLTVTPSVLGPEATAVGLDGMPTQA
jgi:hypothetical protein